MNKFSTECFTSATKLETPNTRLCPGNVNPLVKKGLVFTISCARLNKGVFEDFGG